MVWRKLGWIFCASGQHDWMQTHAANPVAEHLHDDRFRIYFSCRDRDNRSSIGFVEIDLKQPQEILRISEQPVVSPGEWGTFDDSGASMGCLLHDGDRRLLYYLGWNLGVTVPWRNSIGLAISPSADAPFRKVSKAPVLDRNHIDPYSLSYPWVMRDGGVWKMWYGSNLAWGPAQADMAHVIKYAESVDGMHWQPQDRIAIDFASTDEYAISKPCVIRDPDGYRMWYAYRGAAYRIGYAESVDGIHWTRRDDQAGIAPSADGWDAESVEYPCVFDHAGRRYLLYNGKRYGQTGFGLALWG